MSSPAQKARVVQALRAAGRVVAVTGDGANDAPAIRLANVGIAVGRQSTAAARAAADVVLTDERIETLVHAIVVVNKSDLQRARIITVHLTSLEPTVHRVVGSEPEVVFNSAGDRAAMAQVHL